MEGTILMSIAIIIISATIMTFIFTKLKQPSVLAFIVTGVLIGPLVLGWVGNTQEITLISEIGIAFLLFSVGLGTDLNELKRLNLSIILLPIINVIVMFLFLLLFSKVFGLTLIQSLYFSFILSFSSTMLVAKLYLDNFMIDSIHGRIAIGILLVEDLIAILAIPILKNFSSFTFLLFLEIIIKTAIIVVLALFLNKIAYPYIIKQAYKSEQSFFLLSIASCFIFILLSYLLDFPMAVGAFFGGLAVSVYPYNYEISSKISSIRDILATIVFVSLGMQLSLNISNNILFVVFIFVLGFLIKPMIHFFMVLFSGYGTKLSLRVAGDLNQISEFSLIIAMQGIALGQITNSQYTIVIIITSLSMLTTPYVILNSEKIYSFFKPIMSKFKHGFWHRKAEGLSTAPKDIKNHIVVVGSDVIIDGFLKVVARDLDLPILLVDYDPDKLKNISNKRMHYICGDINYKEVINEANLKQAKLAILTAPKFETTIRFLKIAKTINPNLPIYVRAHTKKEALKLYELGADLVILPHILESNYLMEKVCNFIRDGPERNKALRSEYLSYLKKEYEKE